MSKFYDYIKSKEKEIGKDFFCNIEIAKTEHENKVIIYYRGYSFNKDEEKKEDGLRYLIVNNSGSIDVYMNYKDLYVSPKHMEEYAKEGKRLKKLFKVKELREFEKRNENE